MSKLLFATNTSMYDTYIHRHTCTDTNVHTYIHTYSIYTHIHTCTHTHTHNTYILLHSPMPSRGYEVKTTMYTMILDVTTVQPRLIPQVSIILLIDVVNDRLPATCEKQWSDMLIASHQNFILVI